LNGAGYVARDPFLSCTFVENPDTDISAGEAIITSKLLAYAFLLSIEGYPFVFGKDYFPETVWKGAYGLKPWIDNLIWIHEVLAAGPTITQFLDPKVIVINRTGGLGLLTALNFDTFNRRTITCPTAFGANVRLHDYTGRHDDISTDARGQATFTIPSNAFSHGQSYLCFSRAGIGTSIDMNRNAVTQCFFGANDLDIAAIGDGVLDVGRIWCDSGTAIEARFSATEPSTLPAHASVTLDIIGTSGQVTGSKTWPVLPGGDEILHSLSAGRGWLALRLVGTNLPTAGIPFELTVTYIASQTIPLGISKF
jgi:alpha-amylase